MILQTRDFEKNYPLVITKHPSLIKTKLDPINSIYANWMDYQDFHNDSYLATAPSWLSCGVNLVSFEYIPTSLNDAASMSWHLTEREKKDIMHAIYTPYNQKELKRLKGLMKY